MLTTHPLPITTPFYFIRHGETEWNRRGTSMGQTDIPLNERGIQQAYAAQAFLKNLEVGAVYSSSLKRAHQTAQIINEALSRPLYTTDHLRERGWGEGEGKPFDENFFVNLPDHLLPEGAEKYPDFEARILSALKSATAMADQPTLIVAHGGVFMVLTRLMGYPNLHAENCVPYLFRPPATKDQLWFVCELGQTP